MKNEKTPAVYEPFWYELDQTISVGAREKFQFRKNTDPLCFHSGPEDIISPREITCTIVSISHPELGAVREFKVAELQYTVTLEDGRIFQVDAEIKPGTVIDFPQQPTDWTLGVVLQMGKP